MNISDHKLSKIDEDSKTAYCAGCFRVVTTYRFPRGWLVCNEYRKNEKREWAAKNYDPEKNRWQGIKTKYKLTKDEWMSLWVAQGEICAICKTDNPGKKGWATDHNRKCCPDRKSCGKCVRAILCNPCNTAIGLLRDDADLIKCAAAYIEKYST